MYLNGEQIVLLADWYLNHFYYFIVQLEFTVVDWVILGFLTPLWVEHLQQINWVFLVAMEQV